MYRFLIVDDEKIEREGIKFLLSMEDIDMEIFEAENGKQALNILRTEEIDILLTDIKMPHMNGLELTKKAKENNPEIKVIIFSGYSDFGFAQEAIHHGVTEYVLKPVDPERFGNAIKKVCEEIEESKSKNKKAEKEKNFLEQYFLQNYIYTGNKEILRQAMELINLEKWNEWKNAILIETDMEFFDSAEDMLSEEIFKELRRKFFYLNLNGRQSLLLFTEENCDYNLVARNIYFLLKRKYTVRFYLAVSKKINGYKELPDILGQLETQLEEKFYHPDEHIFGADMMIKDNVTQNDQDSKLMERISEDIGRKDIEQLWIHFECLKKKYKENKQFSAMYIKFVFSNVIQELFKENQFADEKSLEKEIERLYISSDIAEIISITEENVKEFESYVQRSVNEARNEVAAVKNYIYNHYREDLSLEMLAEKVFLSSGYLSFIFKKETKMNLNRYIRVFRMEKAKEFLDTTNMKVAQVSAEVGFANVSYFCRSFREYYGCSPESYRKGNGIDENINEED